MRRASIRPEELQRMLWVHKGVLRVWPPKGSDPNPLAVLTYRGASREIRLRIGPTDTRAWLKARRVKLPKGKPWQDYIATGRYGVQKQRP